MNKIVYIEWLDAIEAHAGWVPLDAASMWANSDSGLCRSCGFLIEETPEYILLALSVTGFSGITLEDEAPTRECSGVIKIPVPWITKRLNFDIDDEENNNPTKS